LQRLSRFDPAPIGSVKRSVSRAVRTSYYLPLLVAVSEPEVLP
jgi:hypothetical protein